MKNTTKKNGFLIAGFVVVAVAAYQMGKDDAQPPVVEPIAKIPPSVVVKPKANTLPTDHPPVADANLMAGVQQAPAVPPSSKFTHFRVGNRNVKSIFADDPLVWVGTSGGVIRYDTETDEHRLFSVRNGLLANGIFYVGRLNGLLAVGTYGGGLSLLDEKTSQWKTYNIPEGLGDAFVYDALQMKNGDIWIATWTGVNRIAGGRLDDPQAWSVYTVENTDGGLPNDWVYGLAEGASGELWLATEGGLARYADEAWANWQHEDGLGAPYEQVKDQNLFRNDPAEYSSHHARQKIEQGLQDVKGAYNPNYIVSLTVASDGRVWAGTWGGGLSTYDGANWKTYTMSDGLPSNHVFMLHVDSEQKLWIGTSNGLARLEKGGEFKLFTQADGLFNNTIFSMASQADGTLWIGSFGGIARLSSL